MFGTIYTRLSDPHATRARAYLNEPIGQRTTANAVVHTDKPPLKFVFKHDDNVSYSPAVYVSRTCIHMTCNKLYHLDTIKICAGTVHET